MLKPFYITSCRLSATALEVMAEGLKAKDIGHDFHMPSEVLNMTASWLIKQQDKKTGRFKEHGQIHNRMYAVSM